MSIILGKDYPDNSKTKFNVDDEVKSRRTVGPADTNLIRVAGTPAKTRDAWETGAAAAGDYKTLRQTRVVRTEEGQENSRFKTMLKRFRKK